MNQVKRSIRIIYCHLRIFNLCAAFIILFLTIKAQENLLPLKGEIKDQFGGAIVNAVVALNSEDGTTRTIVTDTRGIFRFERLSAGKYTLQISARGFALSKEKIELKTAGSNQILISLYPTVSENVEVKEESGFVGLDAEKIAGTQVLSAADLENFPDDPDELKRQLQNLAASSGSTPDGAVVTVDGFLTDGRLPSKSAIRQVRVNPNIYSAEYDTPPFRGGRIEISTKPGTGSLTGSAFFNYNATGLNARNPFAEIRAETQTRRYGFQFGMPVIKNRAGFFIDFEKRDIDEASVVNAVILNDAFQPTNLIANIPVPQRLLIGSARADWQANKNHQLIFRYDFNSNKINGLGAGGLNLPDRAFKSRQTTNSFRLAETAIVNSSSVNELRLGLTFSEGEQEALSDLPVIVVAGAFASGGADLQKLSLRTRKLEISNNLIIDAGKHILKIGGQIFNNKTNELRLENQNGTFFFGGGIVNNGSSQIYISGLEQYRRTLSGLSGAFPTRFSVKLGSPEISANQWLLSAFVQDEWKLNPEILLSFGLRAETQTAPTDKIRLAPRLGAAYSPDKKQNWVFRARAGIFYERIDDAVTLESERLDGIKQRQITIDTPSFPNPFLTGTANNPVLTRRILEANLRAPGSLQMRLEFERQLPQGWKISSSYSWSYGWSQLRSRNINAPVLDPANLNPQTAPRPFGRFENILQFESSGRLKGRVLYIGVNQNTNKYFTINAGYLNFDFKTDAESAFSFPQSSYSLSGEWARPFWQARHRLFLSSTVSLFWKLRLFTLLNAASGTPFNITTGQDNNGDGIFNDRPGLSVSPDSHSIQTSFGFLNPSVINGNLPLNLGTNPANITLDLNLSRTFVLKKAKGEGSPFSLTANVRAGNVLNRTNLSGLSGVLNSPFFGRAFAANPARRVELGLRFYF